jgi:NAD(P)-dependent dehydrogenase (short-subunit alcohol dehydrogenase family)
MYTTPPAPLAPFSLAGRAALVTGSSRGIGLGIALALGGAGAQVVFHGIGAPDPGLPAGTELLGTDLFQPDGAAQLVAAAFARQPGLDLLVCNAGSFFDVPFLEMDLERWERTMALNLRSVYFLCQEFARRLAAAQRPGAIVLVASTNGLQPEPNSSAYDTSKGGVVMLTRTLAQSLAPHRIRVNAIAPGLIYTPLTARWIDHKPERVAHYHKKILMERIGATWQCGEPVAFLCSEAASYITGQILTIDGGLTVGQIGKM